MDSRSIATQVKGPGIRLGPISYYVLMIDPGINVQAACALATLRCFEPWELTQIRPPKSPHVVKVNEVSRSASQQVAKQALVL